MRFFFNGFKPGGIPHDNAAFSLNDFQNNGRLLIVDFIKGCEIIVFGKRNSGHERTKAFFDSVVSGQGKRAVSPAVKRMIKSQDLAFAGCLARQLESRLVCFRAGIAKACNHAVSFAKFFSNAFLQAAFIKV